MIEATGQIWYQWTTVGLVQHGALRRQLVLGGVRERVSHERDVATVELMLSWLEWIASQPLRHRSHGWLDIYSDGLSGFIGMQFHTRMLDYASNMDPPVCSRRAAEPYGSGYKWNVRVFARCLYRPPYRLLRWLIGLHWHAVSYMDAGNSSNTDPPVCSRRTVEPYGSG
eukprot:7391771-Prymnesium_polylepis.1